MASPLPSYPQADGSSYYHQPPPPHVPAPFIYEGRNTGPYPYPYPPSHMNNNAHQASSPRARQAHGAYIPLSSPTAGPSYQSYHTHTQHFPHPAQSHPYAHPHSKYPHPQPGPYSYGTPYSPAWSAQQPLSPLPKQLTMPPPRIVSPAPPSNPPPPIPSSPSTGISPINASPPQPSPPPPPLAQAPSPRPPPIHQPKPSTNPSPPLTSPPLPDSGGWAIWSRRPQDPSRAPGIIISPRARPPPDIVQQALDIPTPPASPKCTPTLLVPSPPSPKIVESKVELEPRLPEPEPAQAESASSEHDITSSSATAETTPACSTSPGTSIPSSPQSSNTSVSMVAMSPGKIKAASSPLPADHLVIPDESGTAEAPPKTAPSCLPPAPPPVKKSFASLFTTSSPQRPNSLPTSSVVGISIPASPPTPPPTLPTKNSELLALLTATSITSSGNIHPFRSRGLLNSGNMCFANAVLQVMVYCPPFHRLFTELGRILGGAGFASVVGKDRVVGGTPLVDGTIQFLKEFSMEDANKERDGKGKEVDKPRAGEGEEENPRDAFIPFYIYDAMKEKKRFETMRGGQQEDAEEFFGFYLDALEDELLSVVNVLSQPAAKGPPAHGQVEEREEGAPQPDEGWLEVGKKNRTVITRTVKTADSPITRIFGGKFRSTLRAPAQKDSVVVEDWRSLRLDIQRDSIHTIQDALASISHPQSVQVTFPTRPGVTVDANQQALIEALPPILVLHMKRFLYDASAGGVIKLNRQVRFGPELEVEPDVMAPLLRKPSPTRYKLFGVLYHHGQSASGGHYTLDVLHPDRFPDSNNPKLREGWVRIDDEVVSDIRPDDVFGDDRCAYLLFYTRLGGRSV